MFQRFYINFIYIYILYYIYKHSFLEIPAARPFGSTVLDKVHRHFVLLAQGHLWTDSKIRIACCNHAEPVPEPSRTGLWCTDSRLDWRWTSTTALYSDATGSNNLTSPKDRLSYVYSRFFSLLRNRCWEIAWTQSTVAVLTVCIIVHHHYSLQVLNSRRSNWRMTSCSYNIYYTIV